MTPHGAVALLERPRTAAPIEPWRQERSLMLHLAEVERAAVLAAGGIPVSTRG